jgi:CMP-N-acetylneuraminic acid synthetase
MYKNNKILVIIPARSGSKGIRNKNIKKIKNLLMEWEFTEAKNIV